MANFFLEEFSSWEEAIYQILASVIDPGLVKGNHPTKYKIQTVRKAPLQKTQPNTQTFTFKNSAALEFSDLLSLVK